MMDPDRDQEVQEVQEVLMEVTDDGIRDRGTTGDQVFRGHKTVIFIPHNDH